MECENPWKEKPIHHICKFSTPKIIRYIIDKEVKLDCENTIGERPIHLICWDSTKDIIIYMIDKDVKIKIDNKLKVIIKQNKKLSEDEKDKIIDYINLKNL